MPPAAIPSPTPVTIPVREVSLGDFGDWMSPIIVKELRQGMRTSVFAGAFIALQAILVVTLAIGTAAINNEASSYFFWSMVALILVGVMPLRGFNALAEELKLQTLDLLVLTRLTVWRIAFGKWIALVTQSALIAISTLPYVVLRYFGGGVDVFREISGLYFLWLLSAALTALTVGFSSQRSFLLRLAILIGAAWVWIPATFALLSVIISPAGGLLFRPILLLHNDGFGWVLLVTALWAYVCYFLIDMGSSAIAPAAANHATRKRLASLAVLALAAGALWWIPDRQTDSIMWTMIVFPLLCLSWVDAFTEKPAFLPSTFRPFAKKGRTGFVAALFLAPGWPSGLLFFAFSLALYLLGCRQFLDWSNREDYLWLLNIPSGLVFGLAMTLLFFPRQDRLLAPFLTLQVAFAVYGALMFMLAAFSNDKSAAVLGLLSPTSAGITAFAVTPPERASLLQTSVLIGAISFGYLLVRAMRCFREMRMAMRKAATLDDLDASGSPANPAAM